jgi:prepilin-type N-terminal cleavage/methylation domain-containing protein
MNIISYKKAERGFTLIETLAAIALITVAIVAPMGLTVESIEGAYYARDQITASNLAQEGLEAVRSVRDANILKSALSTQTSLFSGIHTTVPPASPYPFEVDGTEISPDSVIVDDCNGSCGALMTNGTLYGYQSSFKTTTIFTRTMTAQVVWSDPTGPQEVEVTSTVTWKTASYKTETVAVSEDLYDWVTTGSGT